MKEGVGQTLNLLTLARGTPDGASVPGTPFEVLVVEARQPERLERPWWLLVLAGELIIDLPHGDFRILKTGDSLHLPEGLELSLEAVKPAVVLRQS